MEAVSGGPADAASGPAEAPSKKRRPSLRHRMSGRPLDLPPKDSVSSLLIAGAAAGGVSKLLTAPIDRVKIMYQVSTSRPFSISDGMRTAADIVRTSGASALWRGNSVAVVRDVPYAAILFTSYSFVQETICGVTSRKPNVWTRGTAGCAAGAIATCLTYPLDMLRARFGAEWNAQPRYASYASGVRSIVAREGASALFAGLRPTLYGIMPYSALSFAAFETLKAQLRMRAESHGDAPATSTHDAGGSGLREDLPIREKLAAGGAAGLFAQTATYPLHVVRRRMQAGDVHYTSTWHGLRSIYSTEGVAGGLYKGLTLTFIKGPLQSAVGFTINDYVKRRLRHA